MALTNKLSAIGDAVRSKTGGVDYLTLEQIATAISGLRVLPTGEHTVASTGTIKISDLYTQINQATGFTNFIIFNTAEIPASGYYLKWGVFADNNGSPIALFVRRTSSGTTFDAAYAITTNYPAQAGDNYIIYSLDQYMGGNN